jgi:spermidine synthase
MIDFAWVLSLLIGFLSLSEEILWVRVSGFAYDTLPPAFSFVLACYLVGIAAGAAFGKRLCGRSNNLYAAAAVLLAAAALVAAGTPAIIGRLVPADGSKLYIPALAIMVTAALKSSMFPIVHHLGALAQSPRMGRSISRIYFGNIVGATLGPLVTGFVALDYLSVDECFGVSGAACLLMSVACVLKSHRPQLLGITFAAAMVASTIAYRTILPGPGSLLAFSAGGPRALTHFIANRHGLIHTALTNQGEFVYGGNVYDGIATANVDTNPNRLDRVYLAALLHPNPRRILFVGLSAGAWVRAMQGVPGVSDMDVIEINPGYLELIRSYTQLSAILKDPRIHIHIDDGRRWLKRNPDARFDLIIQNTTYYWRANAGNLLSREYFEETRHHLNPGGVLIVNTTESFDVLVTLQSVFKYSYRYVNFGYAADRPLAPDVRYLLQIRRPDGQLFNFDNPKPTSVAALLSTAILDPVPDFLARYSNSGAIITDDNLLSEYRHGRRFGPSLLRTVLPAEAKEFLALAP